LTDISQLVTIAEEVKQLGGVCEEFKLKELDLKDNEINRLEPVLGWLPLESFQVGGNTFRVPQRRVYEQGGTRALLKWLKG